MLFSSPILYGDYLLILDIYIIEKEAAFSSPILYGDYLLLMASISLIQMSSCSRPLFFTGIIYWRGILFR